MVLVKKAANFRWPWAPVNFSFPLELSLVQLSLVFYWLSPMKLLSWLSFVDQPRDKAGTPAISTEGKPQQQSHHRASADVGQQQDVASCVPGC